MTEIRRKSAAVSSLEQLAAGDSGIHALHPLAKLAATAVYLVCVLSLDRYELARLALFLFYPVVLLALAEVPVGFVLRRAAVALPFTLFAGLSGLVFDRAVLLKIGPLAVTGGALSLAVLLVRTLLCVSAVLLLVAVTPLSVLTQQLRRLHVPPFVLAVLEMTYRYLGVLLEEAASLSTAYRLRAHTEKGVALRDLGSLAGGLLLRSFDRAERIFQAMQCRGWPRVSANLQKRPLRRADIVFLALACGSSILFRCMDAAALWGRWL